MKSRKVKRKVKKWVFFVLVAIVLVIIILTLIFLNSKRLVLQYNDLVEVPLNNEVYNIDNISVLKNGTLVTEKKRIDTTKIGQIDVYFEVKDFLGKVKKVKYQVNVVDKESPVIKFKKELETFEGVKIDLLKDVTVIDNSNEKIVPSIEGEYNFDKAGEYKLYYIAKDSSKNEKREEFVLRVKEKVVVSGNNSNNNTQVSEKTFTTTKGFKGVTKNGITYIDGYLVVNKTYTLPSNYGNGLTKETTDNFNVMRDAALKEGLNIYIASGFRSYSRQKTIYNNYVNRDGVKSADTYSARAGHSEHQSGLAFDLNSINTSFANTKEGKWLNSNCYKYGFILRYPKGKTGETGYMYEPWHFRYVGSELASKLYNGGNWITLEDYFGITSEYS